MSPPHKNTTLKEIYFCLALLLPSAPSFAVDYYWTYPFGQNIKFGDMESACLAATKYYTSANGYTWLSGGIYGYTYYPVQAQCTSTYVARSGQVINNHSLNALKINRYGNECTNGQTIDPSIGGCSFGEQKGKTSINTCSSYPASPSIGNRFYESNDYYSASSGLEFTRSYNSVDGYWRHTYSSRLRIISGQSITVVLADSKEAYFTTFNDVITPVSNSKGSLIKTDIGWEFSTPNNERFIFDKNGIPLEQKTSFGRTVNIDYSNGNFIVTDESGNSLYFTEDSKHQPSTLNAPGLSVVYSYDNIDRLMTITRTAGGTSQQHQMLYENSNNTRLLTGVLDQSGNRVDNWTYDDQGRATSSERASGSNKISYTYNADGSTTVINEYGKGRTYRFQLIKGIQKVSSIEGEPTSNCPYSKTSFTYNSNGLLQTDKDAKGNLTTYDYNDRGLETSRTEASGTPQARTITTEWHPTLYLKTKVTEPDRITTYQYDAQGRQTGQIVTPR
ncbi:RHS repeat protein [Pseudomonas sp. NY15435]|uniref:RHS repeat protein n=1 Tax=Pseudomonas sp. NY15435 TaxID=3400358 RepID=UPI003A888544